MIYKIEVNLTEAGYGFLYDIAEETGKTNSVIVEEALEFYQQYLENKNKKPTKNWIFNRFGQR